MRSETIRVSPYPLHRSVVGRFGRELRITGLDRKANAAAVTAITGALITQSSRSSELRETSGIAGYALRDAGGTTEGD